MLSRLKANRCGMLLLMSVEVHTEITSRVSESLSILIRLHKEPHEDNSNQDNHEVEANFSCGTFHFLGVMRREQRSAGREKGKLRRLAWICP